MNDSTYCERVLGRLPNLVDGGLPALDEALDRGHMECCRSCAREYRELQALLCDLRAAMKPSPAEFELELAAMLPRIGQARLRPLALRLLTRRATISLLTAAAAVLLLMAIGGGHESLSTLGSNNLFETLGMANWRLPLGEDIWGAR